MPSTPVTDREAAARELISTLQLHGKRVGNRLAETFGPLLEEGEELPDYLLLQRLMARSVRAALQDLLAADEAHRAIAARLEGEAGHGADPDAAAGAPAEPFLRARLEKIAAELEAAIEAFDETYFGAGRVLEALYSLAGEEELAERLRPRPLAGSAASRLALAADPGPPDEGGGEDQVERRILSRKARRPGLARWLGFRIFRRRRTPRA